MALPASAAWDWKLPPELYKTLNITKRRQLDQAAELFAKGIHPHTPAKDKRRLLKTSLLEWKKIRVQSGQSLDDSTLAYVIFMQAHSAYYAKNRFEAINTYTEVVDYFPNEIWIVVPAIHFTAEAHFANGDKLMGYKSLKKIVDDKDYRKHPLAAGAIQRMADNHWDNEEMKKAVEYWALVWENFRDSPLQEAKNAAATSLQKVINYYIVTKEYANLEAILAKRDAAKAAPTATPETKLNTQCSTFRWVVDHASGQFAHPHYWPSWYFRKIFSDSVAKAKMAESKKALMAWYETKRPLFQQANRTWDFEYSQLAFSLAHTVGNRDAMTKHMMAELKQYKGDIKEMYTKGQSLAGLLLGRAAKPEGEAVLTEVHGIWRGAAIEPSEKQLYGNGLMGTFFQYQMYQKGEVVLSDCLAALAGASLTPVEKERYAAALMGNTLKYNRRQASSLLLPYYATPETRLWADYHIGAHFGDWKRSLAVLDQLEGLKKPELVKKVRGTRAWIYHHKTAEYDKAITAYQQVAAPPGTLWSIEDCQWKSGKRQGAIVTLTEIASMFAADAPRAVYQKGERYREMGEHKKAIAVYRQILMRFKGSAQSSAAHQRLEDYGVKTGGGEGSSLD